jgi:hypothetical protein
MKMRPVEAELLHAGGRTDMTKQTVTFRNFANAPKNAATSHTRVNCNEPLQYRSNGYWFQISIYILKRINICTIQQIRAYLRVRTIQRDPSQSETRNTDYDVKHYQTTKHRDRTHSGNKPRITHVLKPKGTKSWERLARNVRQ